ncbi:unnamed protein product [Pleuronectes platessa]|uniref:Uncharacterized protein n=1 Tax=Pleuronectes platessa TaxID=8262 RepID=A0A9N7Z6R3_PLEPL|nr:unnamed protein product [Pleuronectes platessa]
MASHDRIRAGVYMLLWAVLTLIDPDSLSMTYLRRWLLQTGRAGPEPCVLAAVSLWFRPVLPVPPSSRTEPLFSSRQRRQQQRGTVTHTPAPHHSETRSLGWKRRPNTASSPGLRTPPRAASLF